jgi:hypothetical protein
MGLVSRAAVLTGCALLVVGCSSGRAASPASPASPASSAPRASSGVAAVSVRAAVQLPPVAAVFDYQLGGSYAPAAAVRIVDRDRTSRPAPGRYSICYVNAFQTQPDEAGYWRRNHPSVLLRVGGRYVHDPDWPGEYILDTSTAAKRKVIAAVVGRWFDGCATRGFRAVEPDNLDSWTRRGVHGKITRADDLALARSLVARAHARGLAIAQKNAVEVAKSGHALGFDFAIAEECEVYRECGGYTAVYGRHVIEIEYTDNPRPAYARACHARSGRISIILRDRDVTPRGSPAYRYAHC